MNLKKATQGFTLVEMLVVIAIISILAASLFPAISSAMDMARATSLKTKGKGIWNAIRVANSEREPLGKYALWPKDLEDKGKVSDTIGYWKFLFSKGDGKAQDDPELQLVEDLSCGNLAGSGVTTAAQPSGLEMKYIAWIVAAVNDNSAGELPFIITKNYNGEDSFSGTAGAGEDDDDEGSDDDMLELYEKGKPFANKRAVWITIGGASKDARKRYFTKKILLGNTELKDELKIWKVSESDAEGK